MNSRTAVLITGASGGIGYEFANLFAKDGHDLVLVARNADRLNKVANELSQGRSISVKTVPLDLSTPAAPQSIFNELQREGIAIDTLINNAGFGKYGNFSDIPIDESLGQIQLNVAALTALTRLFVGPMIERRAGKIMNVASTAGFQPGPGMAVYYATKAFVISFSEALANEVKEKGVTVTCLCPGVTDTDFQDRADMRNSRLLRLGRPMDAATVALDGYRALMSGKVLEIPGFLNRLIAQSVRFSPRKLVTEISRRILEH
jgi:short-subunit dehydrogenase